MIDGSQGIAAIEIGGSGAGAAFAIGCPLGSCFTCAIPVSCFMCCTLLGAGAIIPPGVRSRDACFLHLSSLALLAHRGISSYRKRLRGCGCGDAVEPEIALAPLFNDGV